MEKLTQGWVHHLRKTARLDKAARGSCPLCEADVPPDIDSFKAHVRADASRHPALARDADIEAAFKNLTLSSPQQDDTSVPTTQLHGTLPLTVGKPQSRTRSRLAAGQAASKKKPSPLGALDGSDLLDSVARRSVSSPVDRRKDCSSPASVIQQRASSPPAPVPAIELGELSSEAFDRGPCLNPHQGRQLWSPKSGMPPATASKRPRAPASARGPPRRKYLSGQHPVGPPFASLPDCFSPAIIAQPTTKPVRQEQLVAEVRNIYATLLLLENKCIELDNGMQVEEPTQDQYRAIVALHRSLLSEHHNFFLASQHPAASQPLQRLATKYTMPARMWRHAIISPLELLRHKLPDSLEHMLFYIYIAYQMVGLHLETVPTFKETWIECLGDLSRYRMAVEDEGMHDREVWRGVSNYWYSKVSDKAPTTGRLYHHLAVLARPRPLQQLFYFAKSLCVPVPFSGTRESITTLFDPLLDFAGRPTLELADLAFIRVHAIFFTGKCADQLEASVDHFLHLLSSCLEKLEHDWLETGYLTGISLACLLLGFCTGRNILQRVLPRGCPEEELPDLDPENETDAGATEIFETALSFATRTYREIFQREGDERILPCLHSTLVFLFYLSHYPMAMSLVQGSFPWALVSSILNDTLETRAFSLSVERQEFPGSREAGSFCPLPEDFALRGLGFAEGLYPENWFDGDSIDESDRYLELAEKMAARKERILWLGRRLAEAGPWLSWDAKTRRFSSASQDNVLLSKASCLDAPKMAATLQPIQDA